MGPTQLLAHRLLLAMQVDLRGGLPPARATRLNHGNELACRGLLRFRCDCVLTDLASGYRIVVPVARLKRQKRAIRRRAAARRGQCVLLSAAAHALPVHCSAWRANHRRFLRYVPGTRRVSATPCSLRPALSASHLLLLTLLWVSHRHYQMVVCMGEPCLAGRYRAVPLGDCSFYQQIATVSSRAPRTSIRHSPLSVSSCSSSEDNRYNGAVFLRRIFVFTSDCGRHSGEDRSADAVI